MNQDRRTRNRSSGSGFHACNPLDGGNLKEFTPTVERGGTEGGGEGPREGGRVVAAVADLWARDFRENDLIPYFKLIKKPAG